MNQKSSLREVRQFVSQVLTGNSCPWIQTPSKKATVMLALLWQIVGSAVIYRIPESIFQ
jgi:hypothetical protein